MSVAIRGDPVHDLAAAVREVRAAVADTAYPLPLPSAEPARAEAAALLGQLDDYALPRLANLDAPMLVVVGGSTGAGKSTLVNSLVQAPVSAAGVLRPTTRAPVLVCHPADTPWFRSDRLLGGLARTSGAGTDPARLQLIAAPALPPGLAFLDAPDIDSVVAENRVLAHRLFAAADLWLFVTTAARYADAVPWELLYTARERGTVIAMVLDRVPPGAGKALAGPVGRAASSPAGEALAGPVGRAASSPAGVELVPLLSELLTVHGLGSVPLFVISETRVDRQGLLPESSVAPLRSWFDGLAGNRRARATVVRCTLDGALAAMAAPLAELAAAADAQLGAAEALAEQVGIAYGIARGTVERAVRDDPLPGAAVPGPRPPLADEWARAFRATVGGWRDRMAGLTGRPGRVRHRQTAVESRLATVVRSAAVEAAEQTGTAWRLHLPEPAPPAGGPPSPELTRQVQRLVRQWQYGDLPGRVGELLDGEAARWLDRLARVPLDGVPAQRLRDAAAELERARVAAALTADLPPADPPPPPPAEPEPEPMAEAGR